MLAKFYKFSKKCTYTSRLLQLSINGNSIKINKSIKSDNITISQRPERLRPLPKDRQRPQTFLFGQSCTGRLSFRLPQAPAERQTSGHLLLASLGRKTIGVESRRVLRKNCRERSHSYASLRDGYVLIRQFSLRITETRPCYAPNPTREIIDSASVSAIRSNYL